MPVSAVVNIKGGCGKTTTVANLAHALCLSDKQIDVIDLDPQGHLSACLGATGRYLNGMDTVLMSGEDIKPLKTTIRDGLSLVPAGEALQNVEHQVQKPELVVRRLRYALHERLARSDLFRVLIDTPSFPGVLFHAAIDVADELIIPVVPDYLALLSLTTMIERIRELEQQSVRKYAIRIVICRYQEKRRLAREVREKLVAYFPGSVLQTVIRECPLFAEAPSFRKTIFEYRPNCSGAEDYTGLAQDMIEERMAA